ncbi:MAG: hypothetical protein AAF515_22060 [Pseudomonadota bacterium]
MQPTLCEHLESASALTPCRPALVLQWMHGPICVATLCRECDRAALYQLLDWDRSARRRVFALAPIAADIITGYQRDLERGSCDPQRLAAQTGALLTQADARALDIAIDVRSEAVLARRRADDPRMPAGDWAERLPHPQETRIFDALGLDKHR